MQSRFAYSDDFLTNVRLPLSHLRACLFALNVNQNDIFQPCDYRKVVRHTPTNATLTQHTLVHVN